MKKIILAFLLTSSLLQLTAQPLDGIVERNIQTEKTPLDYEPLREADILWEKRVWQIIDVREKQNQFFINPERPLFDIIIEAAVAENLTVYGTENDKFTTPLLSEELDRIINSYDTTSVFDPGTYEESIIVVKNQMSFEDVKRYRIKEIWFFNSKTSQMDVRIIGIAPMKDVQDDDGNFLYEQPMFWVYFPELRQVLAREQVFNINESSRLSWDDWFEQRRFSSTVYKEGNVLDRRLKDYLAGRDLLLEADKIKIGISNFEQDVWSR